MAKDSEDPDQGKKIEEVRVKSGGGGRMTGVTGLLELEIGHNDPVDVDAVHQHDPGGRGADSPWSSLGRLGEKKDEGDEEMAHHEENRVRVPTPRVAVNEEPCFLGDIRIPLEEILAEGDVTPECGEGEKEHSHDVVMFHGEKTLEVPRADQTIRDQDQNRHRGLGTTGKQVDAPHGGVPVMIQRHQPIKSGEGQAQDKEGDEPIGGMTEAEGDSGVPIQVLSHGEISVEHSGDGKKEKVKSASKIKERLVQEGSFPCEKRIFRKIGGHPVP